LAERLPRRSFVIILSDLWLADTTEFARALQHLRYRRHQAAVLHLLDRTEIDLPYDREVSLQDLETDERMQIDPRELREAYTRQVAEHLAEMRRACSNCDVEYHAIDIVQPYDKALTQWINRR
jgi:uncharacterized protein (DUF58 family)